MGTQTLYVHKQASLIEYLISLASCYTNYTQNIFTRLIWLTLFGLVPSLMHVSDFPYEISQAG